MSNEVQGAASAALSLSLAENEAIIEKGLKSFIEVGEALTRIRDAGQYKTTHQTFEAYLKDRWELSRTRGYELIEAAQTIGEMSEISDTPKPSTESVARELKGTPEQKQKAWKETVKRHGSNPTAKQTREVVEEMQPERKSKRKTPLRGRASLSHDPAVVGWVETRINEGWTRERIVKASKAHADGWPTEQTLTNGSFTEVRSVLADRQRRNGDGDNHAPPKKQKKMSGKRLREIQQEKRESEITKLLELQEKVTKAVVVLEGVEIPDIGLSEEEDDAIKRLFSDLGILRRWVEAALPQVIAHMGDLSIQQTIEKMQATAENHASGPGERRNAIEMIEMLERKRHQARIEAKTGTS